MIDERVDNATIEVRRLGERLGSPPERICQDDLEGFHYRRVEGHFRDEERVLEMHPHAIPH